jgi:hypothetical protein
MFDEQYKILNASNFLTSTHCRARRSGRSTASTREDVISMSWLSNSKSMRSVSGIIVSLTAVAIFTCLISGLTSFAQTDEIEEETVAPEDAVSEDTEDSTEDASETSEDLEEWEARLDELEIVVQGEGEDHPLMSTEFDRSLDDALKAKESGLPEAGDSPEEQIARFEWAVTTSDWELVSSILEDLSDESRLPVYNHLLAALLGGFETPSSTLSMDEIIRLAEAAPLDADGNSLAMLSGLIRKSVDSGPFLGKFLARLEEGPCGPLGGDDPEHRLATANLLFSLDKKDAAMSYLQDVESAKEEDNYTVLQQHIERLVERAESENDSSLLSEAWELSNWILNQHEAGSSAQAAAMRKTLELIGTLTEQERSDWLAMRLRENEELAATIFDAIGAAGAGDVDNLKRLSALVDVILEAGDDDIEPWRRTLNILAAEWIKHAKAVLAAELEASKQSQDVVQVRVTDPATGRTQYEPVGQAPILLPLDAFTTAPSGQWQGVLEDDVKTLVSLTLADLYLHAEQRDKMLAILEELAPTCPEEVVSLANEFLVFWADREEQEAAKRQKQQEDASRMSGIYVVYTGFMGPSTLTRGIPLTRARLRQRINDLADLVSRLAVATPEPLDPTAIVNAFVCCYSPTEIYAPSDLEIVLKDFKGDLSELYMSLTTVMRQRLVAQLVVYSEAKQSGEFARTEKEMQADIIEGYGVLISLLESMRDAHSDEWQYDMGLGATLFDQAQFEEFIEAPEEECREKRDSAFTCILRAGDNYAKSVPDLQEQEYTHFVFVQWFNVVLGASDPALIRRGRAYSDDQLQKIRDKILTLEGDAAEKHMAAFGEALVTGMFQLKPEIKMMYLEAGMKVLGDHPSGKPIQKFIDTYMSLLEEVELYSALDGDANVGFNQDFGVFLSLRHTEEAERESGGFSKYLQNVGSAGARSASRLVRQNYRDVFEELIRRDLDEKFEIQSITFHGPNVKSIAIEREGWRETPLAYVLLRTRDPSVDLIPQLQLDMDFADGAAQIVLPVLSQLVPINARIEDVELRPTDNLEITQILDERKLDEEKLILEITAMSGGIIPDAEQLFDFSGTGLEVLQIDDGGLLVNELDSSGEKTLAKCERTWTIEFDTSSITKDEKNPAFQFPTTTIEECSVEWKRYVDADIEKVDQSITLAMEQPTISSVWYWGLSFLTLAVLAAAFLIIKMSGKTVEEELGGLHPPHNMTPFNVLTYLRRIQADGGDKILEKDRQPLCEEITDLEKRFFSMDSAGEDDIDMQGIIDKWSKTAARI